MCLWDQGGGGHLDLRFLLERSRRAGAAVPEKPCSEVSLGLGRREHRMWSTGELRVAFGTNPQVSVLESWVLGV